MRQLRAPRLGRRLTSPRVLLVLVLAPCTAIAGVGLVAAGSQLWRALDLWSGGSPPVPGAFGQVLAAGDFNGDGIRDVAIGDPTADLGAVQEAGVVSVLHGTGSGLSSAGSQLWHQDVGSVPDVAEGFDWFGHALAAGDFDDDGYDDLAIGIPLENDGATTNSGSVLVLYGSPGGLTDTGAQDWHQDVANVPDTNESDDLFGWSLASGDFDHDGYDDLAIGVASEDDPATDEGQVLVLYGSASGLFAAPGSTQSFSQDTAGIPDQGDPGDFFGEVLSSGDYDADGYADLAIGVPRKNSGLIVDAGAVVVIPGSATGLDPAASESLSANGQAIGDAFGSALASADFDADGRDELAVGEPGENGDRGRVHLFELSQFTGWGSQTQPVDQDTVGVPGIAAGGDRFGEALGAGDFDGDGRADLAVGVPGESAGAATGAVYVFFGTGSGISVAGNQLWSQGDLGEAAEAGDAFGAALAAGDFNGDGADDLCIGAPLEQEGGVQVGVVHTLYSIGLCPNGELDPGEECDDENLVDEDGCSALCMVEFCGDGVTQAGLGEACDDGNTTSEDGCSDVCVAEFCGDGVTQAGLGEACDDGNTTSEDGCSDVCVAEVCGDGVVQAGLGETCDDSNTAPGDGCSAACWPELGSADLYGWSMGGSVSITIGGVLVTLSTIPGQSAAEVLAALQAAILADPTLSGLGVQVAVVGDRIYLSLAATAYAIADTGLSETAPTALTAAYTDAAAFGTALAGPGLTQDFDALADGDPVGALDDLTFTTTAPVEPPRATEAFETSSAPVSLGIDNLDEALLDGDPLFVALAQPADAIGLRIVTSDPALLDDMILVTPVGAASNSEVVEMGAADGGYVYFVGLVSDTPFSAAVLGFANDAQTNFVYTVDDVTTHFLPEPGFEVSLGAGLLFLAWARQRRQRVARRSR